jgi:hypothetical protein
MQSLFNLVRVANRVGRSSLRIRRNFVVSVWCVLTLWFVLGGPQFASSDEPQLLSDELVRDGWIQLFDGHSLFGWQATSEADWHVVDGEIRVTGGERGFLMTTTEFADYELHVEFRAPADTNSGIFLRSSENPQNPASDCYELNIAPADNPFPTGGLVARRKWQVDNGPDLADGDWHRFDVVARGDTLTVTIDGQWSHEYVDGSPIGRGFIGLQLNEGPVAFRNIRLRPLGLEPIFNGRDLDGWKLAGASHGEVTDAGDLRITGGSGQLESTGRYGDFVLQLECRIDVDGINSGLFFRSIPGDLMNGYESQIHNSYRDDDPTQPADCGTGGFYRRQNARRIVARDHQWFAKTIIAGGPHMAAWVDGYQVSDWTDTRPPDENPRRGLRLEAGTFCIQGHDPTTDVRFRKLRVVEMPSR